MYLGISRNTPSWHYQSTLHPQSEPGAPIEVKNYDAELTLFKSLYPNSTEDRDPTQYLTWTQGMMPGWAIEPTIVWVLLQKGLEVRNNLHISKWTYNEMHTYFSRCSFSISKNRAMMPLADCRLISVRYVKNKHLSDFSTKGMFR